MNSTPIGAPATISRVDQIYVYDNPPLKRSLVIADVWRSSPSSPCCANIHLVMDAVDSIRYVSGFKAAFQ